MKLRVVGSHYTHLKRTGRFRNLQSKTLNPCLLSCLSKQERSNLFVISQCAGERPLRSDAHVEDVKDAREMARVKGFESQFQILFMKST